MSKDRREEYDEQAYSQDQAYDQDEAYDEEEYDSEDELQEDEDQQEEEDSAYEEEYDEDVFSLEEDLRREHRKQWTQYLVFAICAAVVVGLAIYPAHPSPPGIPAGNTGTAHARRGQPAARRYRRAWRPTNGHPGSGELLAFGAVPGSARIGVRRL